MGIGASSQGRTQATVTCYAPCTTLWDIPWGLLIGARTDIKPEFSFEAEMLNINMTFPILDRWVLAPLAQVVLLTTTLRSYHDQLINWGVSGIDVSIDHRDARLPCYESHSKHVCDVNSPI